MQQHAARPVPDHGVHPHRPVSPDLVKAINSRLNTMDHQTVSVTVGHKWLRGHIPRSAAVHDDVAVALSEASGLRYTSAQLWGREHPITETRETEELLGPLPLEDVLRTGSKWTSGTVSNAVGILAYQQAAAGNPNLALRFAHAVVEHSARALPLVRARAWGRLATAHASAGNLDGFRRATEQCRRLIQQRHTDDPPSLYYLTSEQIDAESGQALVDLAAHLLGQRTCLLREAAALLTPIADHGPATGYRRSGILHGIHPEKHRWPRTHGAGPWPMPCCPYCERLGPGRRGWLQRHVAGRPDT